MDADPIARSNACSLKCMRKAICERRKLPICQGLGWALYRNPLRILLRPC
jgi:hypothetical protein